jgi:hypothetical protein
MSVAREQVEGTLARALAFLEVAQLPSGEFPVYATTDPAMRERCELDPSIFPTAIAAQCLAFCPEAEPLAAHARRFLLAEMDEHGLWRHWTHDHPHYRTLPPDLDDTSCASAALAASSQRIPPNRDLLLANRARDGRFLTWLVPRPRWTGARHMRLVLRQLRHLPTLIMFFRLTSAKPGDVDACVNANSLHYLGRFDGDEAVVAWLLSVLRAGAERQCDKWYENPFVIRYFLSRALAARSAEARNLLVQRTLAEPPANDLEQALSACTLLDCGEDATAPVEALLAAQAADGSWRRAALYHGGRARLRAGGFAEPHPDTPRWGSEAITTAFAVEVLARWRSRAAAA